ncbi:MAG: peptidoglycan-binding domain-containing protein [Candidatus Staskawiczbacteria bacterium]|nr:peptidoglycan-binding domain-containing protein [Candidatus Staskawiczbacteria bacterium]
MKTFVGRKIFYIFIGIAFFTGAFLGLADNVKAANIGDIVNFNVDKSFDATGRTQVPATLVQINSKLYFYIEKSWWDLQTPLKQAQIYINLNNLSEEFDNNIYPNLTSLFGTEWNPGIDNDSKISVLFETMNSTEGGYFREADEYDKLQLPDSNKREMLYLAVSNIDNSNIKIILGHEFAHLITFNQKNKIYGAEEDTWLNEARADYTSTILGYDSTYEGSNLQQRVKDFIENPSDSITDWSGTKYDYASLDLFVHYLVDHYGINVLTDSLKSGFVGVDSINKALSKEGAKENFSQIFTNWTIALAVNDCSQNSQYCYLNPKLNSLRVNPTLIFLPLAGSSSLSATNVTKNWSGNWQKIIGGSGDLKLEFSSIAGLNFQVPYIIYDKSNSYSVNFLTPDQNEKGEINIKDFGTKYSSLIIIPSLQTKLSGFDDPDLIYPYSFTVSITGKDSGTDQALIQKLLAQIDVLKAEIARILGQKVVLPTQSSCLQINNNLYLGASGVEVSCLQSFLKNQGVDIYPEGFVTGNFGKLTQQAAINFQKKYGIPQTGYVGIITRTKINQLLNGG